RGRGTSGAYRPLARWRAAVGGNSSRKWQGLRRDRPPPSRSAHSTQSAQSLYWGALAVPAAASIYRSPRPSELEAELSGSPWPSELKTELSAVLRFEQIAVEGETTASRPLRPQLYVANCDTLACSALPRLQSSRDLFSGVFA